MSNRLSAKPKPPSQAQQSRPATSAPIANPVVGNAQQIKLSWILGSLGLVFLLALIVAAFSMWMILRKHP